MARKYGFLICIFSFLFSSLLFFSFLESRLLRVACALRVRCVCVAGVVRAKSARGNL